VVCRSLAVLAALVLLGGFSNGVMVAQERPAEVPPPLEKIPEAPKPPSQLSPDATGLPLDPRTYVIGPEDIISIKVWREPELSGAKGVRPDGKISMPLIGDLQAGGLTPERLAAQLKEDLEGAGVKNPDLVVEVIQVNSRRFSIQGEVLRPGVFPLVVPIHVFDALGMASGFKEFANKKKILILRADGTRLMFSYDDFVKGRKRDQNVLIQNGDTIIVR
jgi:polysaccharide export outer membrane protein